MPDRMGFGFFPAGFRMGCHPPQGLFRHGEKLLERLHLIFFV
jgi:hypothetical protein